MHITEVLISACWGRKWPPGSGESVTHSVADDPSCSLQSCVYSYPWHTDIQKTQTEAMDPIQTAIILLLVTSVGLALYRTVAGKVKGVQGKR